MACRRLFRSISDHNDNNDNNEVLNQIMTFNERRCSLSSDAECALSSVRKSFTDEIGKERIERLMSHNDSNIDVMVANVTMNRLRPQVDAMVKLCSQNC